MKNQRLKQICRRWLGAGYLLALCLAVNWGTIAAAQAPAAAPAAAPANPADPPNPSLDDLLKKGVPFGQNSRVLRPPTLTDGMTAAQQQAAIVQMLTLKPGRQVTFADFTENGLNTPYVLVLDDPAFGGQNGPGHSIDLWFVTFGKLKKVSDPKFLKGVFPPDPKDKMHNLDDKELKARQIVRQKNPGQDEYFVNGQFMLLPKDNRAQLSATARVVQTTGKESSVLAALIDPEFNNDATYPNEWRPVLQSGRGAGVAPQFGAPVPYTSAGGYAKITELSGVGGALLLEYHLVYDEPNGWFNGANLLRPKLQQKAEDDVRTFRRKVLLGP